MIVGIGVDVVSVPRMERIVARHGDRLAARILAEQELEDYKNTGRSVAFLAKRFAAKEAAAKALGTGFGQGVRKCDIVVTHDGAGQPLLVLKGRALDVSLKKGVTSAWLSLADEKEYALGFVVLEHA